MLVSSMSGHIQRMPRLIVQQQERSAAQHHPETPDQSTRQQHIAVKRLAVAVEIAGQCLKMVRVFGFCWFLCWMPKVRGPGCEHIGKAFGTISAGHLRQECFSV